MANVGKLAQSGKKDVVLIKLTKLKREAWSIFGLGTNSKGVFNVVSWQLRRQVSVIVVKMFS